MKSRGLSLEPLCLGLSGRLTDACEVSEGVMPTLLGCICLVGGDLGWGLSWLHGLCDKAPVLSMLLCPPGNQKTRTAERFLTAVIFQQQPIWGSGQQPHHRLHPAEVSVS